MGHELTAYEVLEVAEKMERNAAQFYRKAAGLCDDPRMSKLFSELAQWEKRHVQIFAKMREHLSEQTGTRGDPEREETRWGIQFGRIEAGRIDASALQAPTPAVFGEHADPARELIGSETKADVLRMAIQKEKDSIAYYASLKEFVLGEQQVETVKDVIREEDRHIRILTQSLEQIV